MGHRSVHICPFFVQADHNNFVQEFNRHSKGKEKKKKLPSEGPYIRGHVERTFPPAAYFSLEPSLDQKQMLPIEAVYKALKIN